MHMNPLRPRATQRCQRGAETVEFTFSALLLLLLLAVFVEVGIAVSDASVFADASRAGARQATVGGTDAEIRAAADGVLTSAIELWSASPQPYSCTATPARCAIVRGGATPGDEPLLVVVPRALHDSSLGWFPTPAGRSKRFYHTRLTELIEGKSQHETFRKQLRCRAVTRTLPFCFGGRYSTCDQNSRG